MDTIVRQKQVIYWPNFVTRIGGGRRRKFMRRRAGYSSLDHRRN
jgi:hypothetical protein